MKRGKKLCSILLAVCMLLCMLPTAAFAAGSGDYMKIAMLDSGRKYFTPDWVKSFIYEAKADGYTHVMLAVGNDGMRFLLDDMSITVNGTAYASADVSAAVHAGNTAYTSASSGEWTESEMNEIFAAANAAGQLGGAMLRRIDPIYMSLVDVCSHFHAVLDYPDEDIEPFELRQHRDVLEKAVNALAAILSTFRRGQRLKNGVRAVILGSPNVGKSSLLNALCGYDRVIVTDVAGTTRDTVEESVTLGRHLLRLLDTAGIHETDDRIEKLGVERAVEAVRSAELAIFVCDRSRALNDADREAMRAAMDAPHSIAVLNKSDLPAVLQPSDLPFDCVVPVCAKTGEGLDLFEQALDLVFPEGTPCDGSILTNERQADAVLRAGKSLDAALTSLRQGVTPDAVLVDVEAAMSALGEVTGRTMREDITNRIFERFCVGK